MRWDERGNLVEDYALKESSPEYQQLQAKRDQWNRQGWKEDSPGQNSE